MVRILLIVLGVLCVALPARALARPKPKIAVAPIVGDKEDQVAQAIADALAGKDYAVVGPRDTGREMSRLGFDELDAGTSRKLAKKLGVAVVIDGKLTKTGRKRSLRIELHRRGKAEAGITIDFKSPTSKAFRRAVHEAIAKKLDDAGDEPPASDDEDEPAAKPFGPGATRSADDRPRRAEKAEKAEPPEEARPRSAPRDDAEPAPAAAEPERKAKRVAADDSGERASVRRRKRKASVEAAPAAPGGLLVRVSGGGSVAQRSLSYATRAGFTQIPPPVATTAGAGRIDGELYPFAIADASSSLAPLGFALSYDKSFGLAIKVPNQTVSAPISQSHYALGARYRFAIGEASSFTVGLDYTGRQYVADRSGLGTVVLDTPDVDYSAIAPSAGLRVPVTDTVIAFGAADVMLVLDAGPIANNANYGAANAYGVEAIGGVDIMFTNQIGLRVAAELSQVMLSFSANAAIKTKANNRDNDAATQDINGATDRSIGLAVTLGLSY